jgi:hypothetical protein
LGTNVGDLYIDVRVVGVLSNRFELVAVQVDPDTFMLGIPECTDGLGPFR